MTLVAGRALGLLSYEDVNKQGILKTGLGRRVDRPEVTHWGKAVDDHPRQDEGKRLVRFSETSHGERTPPRASPPTATPTPSHALHSSDPNSAVRKLFPNSKPTPINPFVNRSLVRDRNSYETNHNSVTGIKAKLFNENKNTQNISDRKTDIGTLRRSTLKSFPETKLKSVKTFNSATPLIERIKQLTCESDEISNCKEHPKFENSRKVPLEQPKNQDFNTLNQPAKLVEKPKLSQNSVNFVRYNLDISSPSRSPPNQEKKLTSPSKTDEARRSFLSSLAQHSDSQPGDRTSVATNSTAADTVYSLSDIEEVLTEEEMEIKEAFSQENKQDELERFVQQDAGRTERLRKRYSSTPKPDNHILSFSNQILPHSSKQPGSYLESDSFSCKKDKPKFGSTIEILQQLQQQIETPYQLEGRRTACSNYSDCSIPISDRLFCDESSDGYEPVLPKQHVYRTCSLDSKNYEEIDNFPSAFSVPRTKSQEHPRLTHLEAEPYGHAPYPIRHSSSNVVRSPPLQQSIYASSPDLHNYRHKMCPDRVSSYSNHPLVGRQLHPVLQRQYCRYPLSEAYSRPQEEGKILTPPVRMHTYMNVPQSAPCYPSPPPYTAVSSYMRPPAYSDLYHYETPIMEPSNIYQNVPFPNSHSNMMTIRRLCTERERGVPEGASSSQDSKETYPQTYKDIYSSTNHLPSAKPNLPPHYCVDV